MPRSDPRFVPDLAHISEESWAKARARFAAIQPLLNGPVSKEVAKECAASAGVHVSTLYRWLDSYRTSERMTALLPGRPGQHSGETRLTRDVEDIVAAVIDELYLSRQRPSIRYVATEVMLKCKAAGVEPPHQNTIRRRIARLPAPEKANRRYGSRSKEARALAPITGGFPVPDRPYAAVQIDHTKLDIELVDDIYREPIGRPWLTLAIDVFSRMVAGFYVSIDPPGAMATGLAIVHAMLPKQIWLARHDISTPWPASGHIGRIHLDNAREFHGQMLDRACESYGIEITWRPVRQPWYGGHIERLLGTFAREIHNLPGSTFSNPAERGDYDSERQAAMTLSEFERWFAILVTQAYHQSPHSELGMTPLQKYESAQPPEPMLHVDERRLRLDFMPYVERTVQPYGISIEHIAYYSDVLRRWINAPDPTREGHKRKFTVRQDPRDISAVYFYDPEAEQYFPVPYRDTTHPAVSIWEFRAMRQRLAEQGRKSLNEHLIFEAYAQMREISANAKRITKSARREDQRRRNHAQTEIAMPSVPAQPTATDVVEDISQLEPFDVEEL